MRFRYEDLFNTDEKMPDAIVISTNGFITSNHNAVLGRGCAAKACKIVPHLKAKVGRKLLEQGNKVHLIIKSTNTSAALVTAPVKGVDYMTITDNDDKVIDRVHYKYPKGSFVPGFHLKADKKIIVTTCQQLVEMADKCKWKNIHVPRLGCGAGELNWEDVFPIMNKYLDDRFIVHTFALKCPYKIIVYGKDKLKDKHISELYTAAMKDSAFFVDNKNKKVIQFLTKYLKYPNVVTKKITKKDKKLSGKTTFQYKIR